MVTPIGGEVFGDGKARVIHFPALHLWVPMDAKMARTRGPERIAPPDFEDRVARLRRGEEVILAGDIGQIRIGNGYGFRVRFAREDKPRASFNRFDEGHPTQGGPDPKITTPAGLYEGGDPYETAVKELREEQIVVDPSSNRVGWWNVQGLTAGSCNWERKWAQRHGMMYDPEMACRVVSTTSSLHWTIYFGGVSYQALWSDEADTSCVELTFTGDGEVPEGYELRDGEELPDGKYRGTEIILGDYANYPQTTKAQVFLAACEAGLTPVR